MLDNFFRVETWNIVADFNHIIHPIDLTESEKKREEIPLWDRFGGVILLILMTPLIIPPCLYFYLATKKIEQLDALVEGSQEAKVAQFATKQEIFKDAFTKKIRQVLKSALDAIHKLGIILTGILPFSARGVLLNLVVAPFLIPIRIVQSINHPDFFQKMRDYMDQDWNQGIQDFYIDLEAPGEETKKLREKIFGENVNYANYMYSSFHKQLNKNETLIDTDNSKITSQELETITENLLEMGFTCNRGNFYDINTGTIFNLIYNKDTQEIVVCFMGLGNEDHAINEENDREEISIQSFTAAVTDWFGGIPFSSSQAIEIGKMIKEVTRDSKMRPVMVGHSHGGGLAQCAAAANGLKGVVFNSRPMGAGTRRYIGQFKVAKNAKNITAFSGKGDWLSGNRAVNVLAALFERTTGIPVPRTVGTGYHLPELLVDEDYYMNNHVKFYEQFIKLKPSN